MDKDRLAVYMLLFAIFAVFVYLGFYPDEDEIVWACNPQPLGTPGAKPFDELNSESQAFILEQWKEEKGRFESVRVGHEKIAKNLAEKNGEGNSQQQQILEDLKRVVESPRMWANPKTKQYVCVINTYRPLTG